MTKFFKGKSKQKEVKPQEPRALDVINKELSQVFFDAGKIKYVIYANERELLSLNQKALALNQEGAARVELDKAAEQAKAAVEGAKNA